MINCGTLPAIAFTHPKVDPLRILLYDFYTVVGAASIENEVLHIRVTLKQDGPNGFFDEASLVVGGRNDSDAGPRMTMGRCRLGQSQTLFRPRPTRLAARRRRKFAQ